MNSGFFTHSTSKGKDAKKGLKMFLFGSQIPRNLKAFGRREGDDDDLLWGKPFPRAGVAMIFRKDLDDGKKEWS